MFFFDAGQVIATNRCKALNDVFTIVETKDDPTNPTLFNPFSYSEAYAFDADFTRSIVLNDYGDAEVPIKIHSKDVFEDLLVRSEPTEEDDGCSDCTLPELQLPSKFRDGFND